MLVKKSANSKGLSPAQSHLDLAEEISEARLRHLVEQISVPRSFFEERETNVRIAQWLCDEFRSYGFEPHLQGRYNNVIAMTPACQEKPCILLGAHYDSVPGSPGADDNGSAVAAMLVCAELIGRHYSELPFCFVAFNCEENGLLGSANFVEEFLSENPLRITLVHVLEMLGYSNPRPGSQSLPPGLPVRMPETGDFLGVLANQRSIWAAKKVLALAKVCSNGFPVLSLNVYLGLEKFFPDLKRSDHASFWRRQIPSLMWTDTSEFRNHHYHLRSDTPETLDYSFLKRVTQLLLISSLEMVEG